MLVGIPTGYALARSAGDTGTESGDLTQSAIDAVRNDPQIAARVGTTPIDINTLRQREAEIEALHQRALAHPDDKNIVGGPCPRRWSSNAAPTPPPMTYAASRRRPTTAG
jgi:hypothetical protein